MGRLKPAVSDGDVHYPQVRASRGLPLRLMAAEYERILKRRLRIVGGLPDDPALGQLLAVFRHVVMQADHAAVCRRPHDCSSADG